ncbi:MAG: zinc ribbon domain-containing protein [Ignavibacteria bacterium]|nr:zinc ribbon domain-containing protein [Ignavibacteria bacterium]
MPTYDYKCLSCGHQFEVFQSMTAELVSNCTKCNGKVKRLIGAGSGPIFKGSGFYQTDYKNSSTGTPNNNSNKTKEAKDSSKKSEGKTKKSSK